MNKGKFSLILSVIIMTVGFAFVLLGVLSYLGVLPSPLSDYSEMLSLSFSITGGGDRLWEAGAFLMLDALLILILRGRRPFSMFITVYLWPMYFTLLSAVRKINEVSFPSYFPYSIKNAHPGLLFVLFILEALLAFVLLSAVKSLDDKWRKKRELNRRMLEKEGIIKTKESIEEEKLLDRERKLKAMEDKKRAKEEAKYERERQKAEKAENDAKAKQAEKDKLKYEKKREKEEERREKQERRLNKKAKKEKDKVLEESQIEKERIDAKAEKIKKKQTKEDEKKRKLEEEERKRREEEEIGPAPEYSSGIGNPNTPLVFPDFDPMPELKNIIKHNAYEEDDVPKLEEEKKEKAIESSAFMECLKEELDRTEEEKPKKESKKRFTSGGMLEATLESAATASPVEYNAPRRPIIGLEDEEEEKEAASKNNSSFAPSNLPPTHPRYRYFENLQKPQSTQNNEGVEKEEVKSNIAPSNLSTDHPRYRYFENLQKPQNSVNEVAENEDRVKNIAPSNLPPTHPRYRYFEEISKNRDESVDVKENVEEKKDPSPSSLPPSHPRRRLFEALETNVSYIPQRPFVPEIQEEERVDVYEDFTPKTEKIPLSPVLTSEDNKAKILEKINASVREENLKNLMAQEKEEEENENNTVFTPPTNTSIKTRDIVENGDGTKTMTVKSGEEEETDFNLCVGVGNLASNIAGYTAIEMRQKAKYNPPLPSLLKEYPGISQEIDEYSYSQGMIIVQTLAEQKIVVELANIIKGPTVTMYELKLAQGMIISKIKAREDELNYALGGKKIRILAPVPGKQAVGIEVPNAKTSIVGFKDMIEAARENPGYMKMKLPMVLGRTITGEPILIDVAKMPHMIIAGTTGSGKSVCINSLINTIIYQKSPKDVRLIMVDPKVVELTVYDGIPHLLTPVITDAKRAIKALEWLVVEMERRYAMLARYGVRNVAGLNEKIDEGKVTGVEKVPYILLIMDEFADIMAVVGKEMDIAIGRIAAKARAAGIHMILATQRPSNDVITGTLKSNLPGRIAFAVSSGINSRVILDETGAENLLGKGDMLLLDPSSMGTKRIQGAFMSDQEVESVSEFTRKNNPPAEFLDESIFEEEEDFDDGDSSDEDYDGGDGDLYEMAKKIVFERHSASASYLQRRLKIGYNRAARIVEMMEEDGIVGPANGSKPREVLRYD